MTVHSFTSFEEAALFARCRAIESGQVVRISRRGSELVVEVTPRTGQSEQAQLSSARSDLKPPTCPNQGTNLSGSRKEKKPKKKSTGMSAAEAKRPPKRGKVDGDPRSIFMTEHITLREVSGGLPSLGKRK